MSNMKLILENWRKFEQGLLTEELNELNWKQKLALGMGALSGFGAMAPQDVAAQTPEREVPVQTTQTRKYTIENRDLQIINAWGGYKMKQNTKSLKNLISVLKKHKIEKEDALKILKAQTQEAVQDILKNI